ncbi:MAG: FAD-dependent oxidoreductase [Eubacterium sp.]
MQRESLWEQYSDSEKNKIKQLKGDIRADVLIIGGGIAGILCAWRLKQAGVSCIIVEKGNFLEGVTRNTTAKITAQHGLIYNKIQKIYDREKAEQYYKINNRAISEYWKLNEQFPCDMESRTAYVYSTQTRKKLEKEAHIYDRLGISYVWQEYTPIPIRTYGALGMDKQAQFNPMKLLLPLAEQIDFYENTTVTDIKDRKAYTEYGTIEADQIVLATHFPMVNIPGGYFAKMYQRRSYALAIKDGPQMDGMYIDDKEDGFSFRNYQEYLLVGGGGHKTGTRGGGYAVLEKLISQVYPDKKVSFAWSAQDCMSLDGIPYIGCHSKRKSHMFVAAGFNKWGMTGAMSSAIVLEELLTKGNSEFKELFSPQRSIVHPQLAVNLISAVGNILRPGRRCTHMGCSLRWNPQERTWDCPCHGSRYSEDGNILENPAKKKKEF